MASVEDYLPAGNVLGYNWNWQYRHTGGELLMMGQAGEPSGYYPTDSNGLSVGTTPPVACVCQVAASPMVCAPLEYGGCASGRCEGVSSAIFLMAFGVCTPQIPIGRECTPGEWDKCRKQCKKKGGKAIGCIVVINPDGSERVQCTCMIECSPKDWEKCRKDCRAQGKIAIGCVILDTNGKRERKCTCFP